MQTLGQMLLEVVAKHSARPALVERGEIITYAELGRRVAGMAGALTARGIERGARVGLLLPNGADFLVSYLAVTSLGALVVPLNEHYQQTELLYFLDGSTVSLLITAPEFASLAAAVLPQTHSQPQLLVTENAGVAPNGRAASLHDHALERDPDAIAMHQFSSGSTGTPKRIARTHGQLTYELESLKQALGHSPADRFLGAAPWSHVNGMVRTMLSAVCAGAALYPLAKFERYAAAELIEKNRLTVFIAVPFMFSVIAQTNFAAPPDFSSLRLCVSASAPMPNKFNQLFHEKFGRYVRQLYGSTETGSISVNLLADPSQTLDSVGTPLRGVSVAVLDEQGQTTAPRVMGEFAVSSVTAIKSYEGLASQDSFRDGSFLTGDLGWQDEAGNLYLVGRKKFFINKGGYKINPVDIQDVLESHPRVREAAVLGAPTPYGDEKVKAVVVPDGAVTAEELVEFCRGKIADFKIPSVIEFRESLPKSPAGKLRRNLLT